MVYKSFHSTETLSLGASVSPNQSAMHTQLQLNSFLPHDLCISHSTA